MEKRAADGPEERETRVRQVWVGEADRIASFHAIEGYRRETFASHERYLQYLLRLQERGFRFQ